jgi:hypothetical protein
MGAYLLPDSDGLVPLSPIFPTAAQMGHKFPLPRAFLARLISEIEDDDKMEKLSCLVEQ